MRTWLRGCGVLLMVLACGPGRDSAGANDGESGATTGTYADVGDDDPTPECWKGGEVMDVRYEGDRLLVLSTFGSRPADGVFVASIGLDGDMQWRTNLEHAPCTQNGGCGPGPGGGGYGGGNMFGLDGDTLLAVTRLDIGPGAFPTRAPGFRLDLSGAYLDPVHGISEPVHAALGEQLLVVTRYRHVEVLTPSFEPVWSHALSFPYEILSARTAWGSTGEAIVSLYSDMDTGNMVALTGFDADGNLAWEDTWEPGDTEQFRGSAMDVSTQDVVFAVSGVRGPVMDEMVVKRYALDGTLLSDTRNTVSATTLDAAPTEAGGIVMVGAQMPQFAIVELDAMGNPGIRRQHGIEGMTLSAATVVEANQDAYFIGGQGLSDWGVAPWVARAGLDAELEWVLVLDGCEP